MEIQVPALKNEGWWGEIAHIQARMLQTRGAYVAIPSNAAKSESKKPLSKGTALTMHCVFELPLQNRSQVNFIPPGNYSVCLGSFSAQWLILGISLY